jgi:hypothetical protein
VTTFVPRTKQQRNQLAALQPDGAKTVTLKGCGHETDRPPQVSNPDRYWCCGQFREARK